MNWWIFGISVWLFCIALIWAFFLGACGGKAPEIKFKGGVKSMTKKGDREKQRGLRQIMAGHIQNKD